MTNNESEFDHWRMTCLNFLLKNNEIKEKEQQCPLSLKIIHYGCSVMYI